MFYAARHEAPKNFDAFRLSATALFLYGHCLMRSETCKQVIPTLGVRRRMACAVKSLLLFRSATHFSYRAQLFGRELHGAGFSAHAGKLCDGEFLHTAIIPRARRCKHVIPASCQTPCSFMEDFDELAPFEVRRRWRRNGRYAPGQSAHDGHTHGESDMKQWEVGGCGYDTTAAGRGMSRPVAAGRDRPPRGAACASVNA